MWTLLPASSNPCVPLFLSLRSASFSQGTRASFLMRSDTAVQKLAQGNGHCVNGVGGQVHGFYSLPKPTRHNAEFRDSAYDLPRSLAAHGHTKGSGIPVAPGVLTLWPVLSVFKWPARLLGSLSVSSKDTSD